MSVTMREMLEAGVHFGHQTRFWNPKMAPYIYGHRNKIHIINLEKTLPAFEEALKFVRQLASKRGTILMVGTKRQARDIVAAEAERAGVPSVNQRWLGGTLTNFKTVKTSLKKLKDMQTQVDAGTQPSIKKEALMFQRDIAKLERIRRPFPRMTYHEAVAALQKKGNPIQPGDDFGGDEETLLSNEADRPLIVHRYPMQLKAFYMQNDPATPDLALCMDVLAPEGYGEIIGGGQRIHEHDKLLSRIREHHLPEEAFRWYLDLRRFGAVPHAGFGMGIERAVAWICGLEHVRETIPFPRMLYKLYP